MSMYLIPAAAALVEETAPELAIISGRQSPSSPSSAGDNPEELASLEDTLELLSDPDAMRQLDESRQAYGAGDFVTGDELRRRYLAR